jgi:adenylate cyclase
LFEAYYYWARTHWHRGDLEKAAELFKKAGSVRPEDYQAILLAANAYRGLNRMSDLEAACRQGLEIVEKHVKYEPDDARAWQLGAQAHCEMGDQDRALEWIKRAMSLDRNDSATFYNAACVFSELGMLDDFFHCFERAIENGYACREWIENDPYLENARDDPRFFKILEKL